jgi:4-diphosphocytidyl-2-C-methyl-D-erythritol kinase
MAALEALSIYAPAMMTGTGACVFARFDSESAASVAWGELSRAWNGFVAKGMQISPVHTRLQELANKA